ncbi:MAG: hypothetical protein ACAI43_20430, partial [Phycisphaerae bacterium]
MASSSRPSQRVSDETLARWRERLAGLRAALGDATAGAEQAWFWRLQFAIFAYLLKRYAGEHVSPPAEAPGGVCDGLSLLPEPSVTPAAPPSRPSALLPQRSIDKIRGRVSSLVAENRERVEAIAAEQAVGAAERIRQREFEDQRVRDIRAEWAKVELDRQRAYIASAIRAITYDESLGIGDQVVMTEDELLAILN